MSHQNRDIFISKRYDLFPKLHSRMREEGMEGQPEDLLLNLCEEGKQEEESDTI